MKIITRQRFDEMLNMLPPIRWGSTGGWEHFACCEAYSFNTHHFYFWSNAHNVGVELLADITSSDAELAAAASEVFKTHQQSRVKTMEYHILCVWESDNDRWVYEFGDYDLNVVCDERDDLHSLPVRSKRIVSLKTDTQAAINAAVDKLNDSVRRANAKGAK